MVNGVENVMLQANKGVKLGKIVRLAEVQGVKMGTQQMVAKIVHTGIAVIAGEKGGNM